DPETGRSKPKWVGGFETEDAAKEARDDARVKAYRGEYVDKSSITVAEYLDEWLASHAVEVKPTTLAGYRHMIELYVKPHIGSKRLQTIRPATLTKLYRDLRESGGRNGKALSVRTVNYTHAVLRKALNDAVQVEYLIPSNPADRAKRPKKDHRMKKTWWSTDELAIFLDAVKDHPLYSLFHMAAYTGARRGELLNLRWPDIDWKKQEVTIRGTVSVVDGDRVEGTTKGGMERVVSLDQGTLRVLKAHRKHQAAAAMELGEAWSNPEGYVFTAGTGAPLYPDTPSQTMARLIRDYNDPKDGDPPRKKLPHARFHDLRHVHATTLLLAGVPVHVVAERLGHADPSITLRVYAHVIRRHAAGVADVFAAAMGGDGLAADQPPIVTPDDPEDEDPPAAAAVPC
ncbi:MAG: tyrosine-type recombinase/integrase, partial [Propionibacteriales bacterium]|nr:tyrosine-type recombinase/integrase [Propionibacteriales bacterium]